MKGDGHHDAAANRGRLYSGFGLTEFLMSTLVLLVFASMLFGLLVEIQRKASYQAEMQSVLNNTRLAMQTVGRYLRQAGNDPMGIGVSGITIISPTELRVESDITGSVGPSSPDNGDPDGDTLDSGERITIRYNSASRSLETVTGNGAVQIIAGSISDMLFRCFDSAGNPATPGGNIRRVNVTISGASLLQDPATRRRFGVQLQSNFEIAL